MSSTVKIYYKMLGEKIRTARKQYGISQKKLAEILHVSDKAISSYEVGRTSPPIELLEKLSKTVQKPLSYFGNENKESETTIVEKLQRIETELQEIKTLLKKRDIKEE